MPENNNGGNNKSAVKAGKPFFGKIVIDQPAKKDEKKQTKSDFEVRIGGLVEKGIKRGRRYSWIGIVTSVLICLVVLAAGYFLITEINSFSQKAAESSKKALEINEQMKARTVAPGIWKICESDLDCVETRKGCCACAMGGEQAAVNINYLGEWEKLLNQKCGDASCIALYNCFLGRAVCQDGKCVFKKI